MAQAGVKEFYKTVVSHHYKEESAKQPINMPPVVSEPNFNLLPFMNFMAMSQFMNTGFWVPKDSSHDHLLRPLSNLLIDNKDLKSKLTPLDFPHYFWGALQSKASAHIQFSLKWFNMSRYSEIFKIHFSMWSILSPTFTSYHQSSNYCAHRSGNPHFRPVLAHFDLKQSSHGKLRRFFLPDPLSSNPGLNRSPFYDPGDPQSTFSTICFLPPLPSFEGFHFSNLLLNEKYQDCC